MKVLLLHALPLDERMWEPQLRGLDGLDVEAPRLYGRGNDLDALAASLLGQLDGELVAVGASFGGYCALALARRAPERVLGIALVGSRPDADDADRRAGRADTIATIRRDGPSGLWEVMRPRLLPDNVPAHVVDRARAIAIEQDADELVAAVEAVRDRPDSTELARSYGDRLLVAVGTEDPYVSVDEARSFSNGPEAVFPGIGHLPSLERPDEFNGVLLDFLSRWTSGSTS